MPGTPERQDRVSRKRIRWIVGCAALLAVAAAVAVLVRVGPARDPGRYRVYALEYGRAPRFRSSAMLRGAPAEAWRPASFLAWLVAENRPRPRILLVDTGFADRKRAASRGITRHRPVPELLRCLGLSALDITDVVLTHAHWDHVGDTAPYSRARFYIQRQELAWAEKLVSEARPERQGVRLEDVKRLLDYRRLGRLVQVDGDQEIAEGIALRPGGLHTPFSQWVEIRKGGSTGTIVLASDNAYLYDNIEKDVAIGATADPGKNLAEIRRMKAAAGHPRLVIPGHDPDVMKRFRAVCAGVAEID